MKRPLGMAVLLVVLFASGLPAPASAESAVTRTSGGLGAQSPVSTPVESPDIDEVLPITRTSSLVEEIILVPEAQDVVTTDVAPFTYSCRVEHYWQFRGVQYYSGEVVGT